MDVTELVCFAPSLPKSQMNTAHQKIILVVCRTICEIEVQRMAGPRASDESGRNCGMIPRNFCMATLQKILIKEDEEQHVHLKHHKG